MYFINDLGNIAVICLLLCVGLGLLGLGEIWPMVAGLAFIVFVAAMLQQ